MCISRYGLWEFEDLDDGEPRIDAEVRSLDMPNRSDLSRYWGDAAESFRIPVDVEVGTSAAKDRVRLRTWVCSPDWLIENHSAAPVIPGWGMFITAAFDRSRVEQDVKRLTESHAAANWELLKKLLARVGSVQPLP